MSRAAVVVPWQPGSAWRAEALQWVAARWAEAFPSWPFVLGEPPGPGWCKGRAIAAGLAQTDAELIVVADADVWPAHPSDIGRAVEAVAEGRAEWAIPHARVWRLNPEGTEALYAGARAFPSEQLDQAPYTGVECGGLLALPASTARAVPCDPRFEGWGGQDFAWSYALRCLMGKPWRGRTDLWHLWHPPQERISRRVGSQANEALRVQYARARRNPQAMTRLVAAAIVELQRTTEEV